jgi:hypothetical protein
MQYSLPTTATITLTVTLAATVFAVVDGVLFHELPFADPRGRTWQAEQTAPVPPRTRSQFLRSIACAHPASLCLRSVSGLH